MNRTGKRTSALKMISVGILSIVLIGWLVFGESGFFGRLNTIGYAFCHQIPSRTPAFIGFSCPLCFRCSGLFFGIMSGLLILRRRRFSLREFIHPVVLIWVFLSVSFYVFDGVKTYGRFPALTFLYPDSGLIRYVSGIWFGSALALALTAMLHEFDDRPEAVAAVGFLDIVCYFALAVAVGMILSVRNEFLIPFQFLFSVAAAFLPVFLVSILFFVMVSAVDRIVHQGVNRFSNSERILFGTVLGFLLTAAMVMLRYQLTGGWVRMF